MMGDRFRVLFSIKGWGFENVVFMIHDGWLVGRMVFNPSLAIFQNIIDVSKAFSFHFDKV